MTTQTSTETGWTFTGGRGTLWASGALAVATTVAAALTFWIPGVLTGPAVMNGSARSGLVRQPSWRFPSIWSRVSGRRVDASSWRTNGSTFSAPRESNGLTFPMPVIAPCSSSRSDSPR